jgi:hypothetical protein
MLTADDSHLVNIRLSKDQTFPGGRRLTLSGDVFNLFNVIFTLLFRATKPTASLSMCGDALLDF